ncbi:hypothetical protein LUZ61_014059 [Rhynchospora tenuis]|uniref:Glycosyltransferase n=1 Tax=Rhynchospora tenuis TaxID=198213 RepID=A0AAD5W9Y3_9POAL|nr:hypothetical protein LUZ61_014059 [Rhynchospora tenuis]
MAIEKATIVLYPSMGVGHLAPMVHLAKRFVQHGFSVTVAIADQTPNSSTNEAMSNLSMANPSISFHALPLVSFTPAENSHPLQVIYDTIREYNPKFLEFLTSLSTTTTIHAIVIDFFRTDAIGIARQLGIPVYVFFASGASILALSLHLPLHHATSKTSFKDMGNATVNFPGAPPIPASGVPETLLDRASEIYHTRIRNFTQLREVDGILVNSFEALEQKAVKALKEGLCLPGHTMPPVYCIGPLITVSQEKSLLEKNECLNWLDSQPKRSVIFLSFGSAGAFTAKQINEIAIGLEKSGQRFLWVVRSTDNPKKLCVSLPDPDLDSLLPEGFLSRTKERGMVVKSWAPQVEVLNHESIGGFVSHCGWNSTLEAMVAGMPIICWPLYAEQRLNKVILEEEIKVGVVMKGYNEELVSAEEVEEKARWLMESKEGQMLRERMVAVQKKAFQALAKDGSSEMVFTSFLRDLRIIKSTTRADQ